jgi:tetratricopeptide (TPR) repeat protein
MVKLGSSELQRRYQYLAIILLAGVFTYLTAFWANFLSIDDIDIFNIFTSASYSVKKHLLSGAGSYFRPVAKLSFYFDHYLFGLNSSALHLVNVAIHLCNSLLVYYLALELADDHERNEEIAFLSSLIFALHPVNTEAVLWIAARTDLLCSFFSFASLILFVRYLRQTTVAALPLLFLSFLAALLSKESAVALLVAVPLYCLAKRNELPIKHAAILMLPFVAATCVYFLLRMGPDISVDHGVSKVIAGARPQKSFIYDTMAAYGFYVKKMLYPFPLNFAIMTIDKSQGVMVFAATAALSALLFLRFRDLRLPLLVMLAGIVPPLLALIGKLPWTPYAERYVYMSMAGLSLVAAMVAVRCLSRRLLFVPVSLALLLAIPSMARVSLWADPVAFWQDTLEKSAGYHRAKVALAHEYLQLGRLDMADSYLDKALAAGFEADYLWQHKATVALALKDYDGYETAKLNAIRLSPDPTSIYRDLAVTMMKIHREQGDVQAGYRKAIHYYQAAYDNDPSYAEGLYSAGKLCWVMGDNQRAAAYMEQFISLKDDNFYKPFAVKILNKITGKKGGPAETAP